MEPAIRVFLGSAERIWKKAYRSKVNHEARKNARARYLEILGWATLTFACLTAVLAAVTAAYPDESVGIRVLIAVSAAITALLKMLEKERESEARKIEVHDQCVQEFERLCTDLDIHCSEIYSALRSRTPVRKRQFDDRVAIEFQDRWGQAERRVESRPIVETDEKKKELEDSFRETFIYRSAVLVEELLATPDGMVIDAAPEGHVRPRQRPR